ncbi:hypothetical protein HG535_0A06830 [Zygotorulaspora mrakii]|uniref:Cx9C motif-containing protein 4, mitochondrial n=1 Tax=Zygotorulaspora mrakii TaxID=42260 RepID=A0A7H9AWU3_ZYGMR|nr:uncharacterized protein HG535_0A06830 [Zygotorulaspora mrakii]QLG70741.1 hypothetical protein HG535_0A06830 [Zygotorulaspora mrakii]
MSDPCKREACDIQRCLLSHNYNEEPCQPLIDDLYRCCFKFYKANGNGGKTPCCPMPDLLELKMEQRNLKPDVNIDSSSTTGGFKKR